MTRRDNHTNLRGASSDVPNGPCKEPVVSGTRAEDTVLYDCSFLMHLVRYRVPTSFQELYLRLPLFDCGL